MAVGDGSGTLAERADWLWVGALCFYGVGDTLTTVVGLTTGRGAEAGPLAAGLVASHGLYGLVALKLVTLAGFYALWRLLRTPGRVAVPLALVVVGLVVTAWNAIVLVT